MLNPILASRLNRADLSGYSPPPVQDPYSNPQIAAGGSGQLSAAMSLDPGRIAAILVGVMVIGGAGFYLWTRRFQA
jgi:hypothetical protein